MATKEQAKAYYQKNRERVLARVREYGSRPEVKEVKAQYRHKYYLNNWQRIQSYNKDWDAENRERRNELQRLRRTKDPLYKLKTRVITARGNGGYYYTLAPSPDNQPVRYKHYWFLQK